MDKNSIKDFFLNNGKKINTLYYIVVLIPGLIILFLIFSGNTDYALRDFLSFLSALFFFIGCPFPIYYLVIKSRSENRIDNWAKKD